MASAQVPSPLCYATSSNLDGNKGNMLMIDLIDSALQQEAQPVAVDSSQAMQAKNMSNNSDNDSFSNDDNT